MAGIAIWYTPPNEQGEGKKGMREPTSYPYDKESKREVQYWTCPACRKVTIVRLKGESDQLKKIEFHLVKFHGTNSFFFFQKHSLEEVMKVFEVQEGGEKKWLDRS